jgi:hypothetical protein
VEEHLDNPEGDALHELVGLLLRVHVVGRGDGHE